MPPWTRDELELHLSITTENPSQVSVYTNWPYYVTRVENCEGFQEESAYEMSGGKAVSGIIDVSEYQYLWLRKSFGSERSDHAYWQKRMELPQEPVKETSNYRAEPHERETHFMLVAADPYWFSIETDAAVWQRRLDKHPYAVCILDMAYASSSADEGQSYKKYLLPRSLLTIRKARPKYSEEHREQLRQRVKSFRSE